MNANEAAVVAAMGCYPTYSPRFIRHDTSSFIMKRSAENDRLAARSLERTGKAVGELGRR